MVKKKRKRIAKVLIGIGIVLVVLSVTVLYFWSRLSLDLSKDNYLYDPPGGCLQSEVPSEIERLGYLTLPVGAENIKVLSDKPSTDICYIMTSFSLSSANLIEFLHDNAIELVSSPFSGGGFWHGVSIANWPLVEGKQYLHGSSSRVLSDVNVLYEHDVMYVVIVLGS
jgi:flagellar basal body-associated protein FliL